MNLKLLTKTQVICAWFLLCTLGAYAQSTTIKGTVISATDKQPLVGVNVLIEGNNTRGASTDAAGHYSIQAKPTEVLVFSFIGCKAVKEAVNQRTIIDVQLADDSNQLDDVIVMGYSTQTKAELSSSVVTLKGSELTDITTPTSVICCRVRLPVSWFTTPQDNPVHNLQFVSAVRVLSPLLLIHFMWSMVSSVAPSTPTMWRH